MEELPGIAVAGVSGRMGRLIVETVAESERASLLGATERPGHDWIGEDLGICLGGAETGVVVQDAPLEVFDGIRAFIDFTTPAASVELAELCAQAKCAHVIGSTGFEETDLNRIAAAARHTTIVRAGNMSLGVNLLMNIVRTVARSLDDDYDVEIVETHHRHKVDAPSGTAIMLGQAAAEGRELNLGDVAERGRDGITGPRRRGAIGISAVRGGDVTGEHDVIFAGDGERIVLRHIATNRSVFAQGALKAALWALNRPPGEYSMRDVLSL
ncbi:MAG: 4-hydroxy-tetrahydrodipicolinate reductase [Albidovulum sp.]|nr:4-hydroxy-tetrahydrodipicolinate reductase [Albidovulum sp.]